ncbi:hypothetical protein F4824DRAFT_270918 [Ustulina deusta]|nr:hypothetical protein F4824DRAFT_270918 [Ustulina deusta]
MDDYYENQTRQALRPSSMEMHLAAHVAPSQALPSASYGRPGIVRDDEETSSLGSNLDAAPGVSVAYAADPSTTYREQSTPSPVDEENATLPPWGSSDIHALNRGSNVPMPSQTIAQMSSSQLLGEEEESLDAVGPADTSDQPTDEPSPHPPLSLKQSLGITGCVSILGGHIVLVGVIVFLSFLWFGHGSAPEGAEATELWRTIATRGWMIRAITLSALVLRFIVSVQAAVCTSMIAAIVLEQRRVRRSQAAWFSIMRSLNDGPRQLIQMMVSSGTVRILFEVEFWLIVLVALTGLGLQFTSTILLGDLRNGPVIGDVNSTQVKSLLSYDKASSVTFVSDLTWATRSPIYSVYGEVSSQFDASTDSHGRSDTGVIQRGFLPFVGSENRTSIRSFQGNTMVMSSRAMCIQPNVSNVHISESAFGGLLGTVHYQSSLRAAGLDDSACDSYNCRDRAFGCFFPTQGTVDGEADDYNDWQSSFCLISGEEINNHSQSSESRWEPADNLWSHNSTVWLVMSTNMGMSDYENLDDSLFNTQESPAQEWSSFRLSSGRSLNITLCFTGFDLQRSSVKMATSGILHEPKTDWSFVQVEYNTTDAQNYILPSSSLDHVERGLLDLDILGDPEDGGADSPANAITPFKEDPDTNATVKELTVWLMTAAIYDAINIGPNETFRGCYNCIFQGVSTHPEVGMLFTDIVSTTKHASMALQSFMTILATTIYETYMSSLSGLQDVRLTRTAFVPIPGPCDDNTCAGFISVSVLLGVNLICTTIIVVLYSRQVRYSRYANVWHAVSQLVAEELKDLIDRSNMENDAKSTADTTAAGAPQKNNGKFVTLGPTEDNRRVEIIPCVGSGRDKKSLG